MELVSQLIDFILHLDQYLEAFTASYGAWVYGLLFLIIFCETGLVVTPFLPGDSLLFVAGTLAAAGGMDINLMIALLIVAAVLGDSLNYAIGAHLGPRVFTERSRFLKREHLARASAFYVRHGGKTIVLARFMPIIRTYAPFVAGIGKMHYGRFAAFNVGGAIVWVASLSYAGFFFGNMQWVKENLSLVLMGIILLSISPAILEFLRSRNAKPA
jgi:membrane-associated protein